MRHREKIAASFIVAVAALAAVPVQADDITIKAPRGQTLVFKGASSSTSVCEVKKFIKRQLGISTAEQKLTYSGKTLENSNSLGRYNMSMNPTLMLKTQYQGSSREC